MQLTLTPLELPLYVRLSQQSSEGDLLRFCAENDSLRIEREPNGELHVMSPSGSGTGNRNADIIFQLMRWAMEDGRGNVFDSNSGFTLPDGSVRSPDASWVGLPRWAALTREQQSGFAPLCPEFVIELRSPSDNLADLQAKMRSWLHNGAQLAWLIDPERQVVEIYRPGTEMAEPQTLQACIAVEGEGPAAGFTLDLARIWS